MTSTIRALCEYDLGFPLHYRETESERLLKIQSFIEQHYPKESNLNQRVLCDLEEKVASLLGKDAAIWCPTGTLIQGIAARVYAEQTQKKTIVLHPTSHLVLHEEDGYQYAHGLQAIVKGGWRQPVTADLFDESLEGQVACAFIELPQRHNGGLLPTWKELEATKAKAAALNIPLHMDGARVWSSRSFYQNRSYAQIAAGFNSAYVSLYKDIGAIGGAVLVGDNDFISEARLWRTRLGGLPAISWAMVCDALRLIDVRLEKVDEHVLRAQQIASLLKPLNQVEVEPAIPQINMFHLRLPCSAKKAEAARDKVAKETGVWLSNRLWQYEGENQCSLELPVGDKAMAIADDKLFEAFSRLTELI